MASSHRVSEVLDALEKHYGKQTPRGASDAYEMIVWTNCGYPPSDETCQKGYSALKKDVGMAPQQILKTPKAKLTKLMRLAGIVPELRADRLKWIARTVKEKFGGDLQDRMAGLLRGSPPSRDKALQH